MKIIQEGIIVVIAADEGMVLQPYGQPDAPMYLGKNDSPDNYAEITLEKWEYINSRLFNKSIESPLE